MSKVSDVAAAVELGAALEDLKAENTVERIRQNDASVWSARPEHEKIMYRLV